VFIVMELLIDDQEAMKPVHSFASHADVAAMELTARSRSVVLRACWK
jgi:hypothetical protein